MGGLLESQCPTVVILIDQTHCEENDEITTPMVY